MPPDEHPLRVASTEISSVPAVDQSMDWADVASPLYEKFAACRAAGRLQDGRDKSSCSADEWPARCIGDR